MTKQDLINTLERIKEELIERQLSAEELLKDTTDKDFAAILEGRIQGLNTAINEIYFEIAYIEIH